MGSIEKSVVPLTRLSLEPVEDHVTSSMKLAYFET